MALAQAAARRAKNDLPDRKQRVFHQRPSSITSGYVTEEFYSDRHRQSVDSSAHHYARERAMNDSYRNRNTRIPEGIFMIYNSYTCILLKKTTFGTFLRPLR